MDSGVYNVSDDKEIKKVLVGIDISPAEILIAKELGGIDLVIIPCTSRGCPGDADLVLDLEFSGRADGHGWSFKVTGTSAANCALRWAHPPSDDQRRGRPRHSRRRG